MTSVEKFILNVRMLYFTIMTVHIVFLWIIFCTNEIVVGQDTSAVTDVNYQIISIPNGGFLQICTKSGGPCSATDWIPVCMSTGNSNAQSVLKTSTCQKFGYDDGKLFSSAQSLCFLMSCPNPNSPLQSCTGYTTSMAKATIYVVCYTNKCSPVSEPISGGTSVDCDFENNDSCEWKLQNWNVQTGTDPDHTIGSKNGHYLTTPQICPGASLTYSVALSGTTVGCNGCQQNYCFSFYAMNTGFQPTLVISAVYSSTENETFYTKNTLFNQAYTQYMVPFQVSRPFQIGITTWCTTSQSYKLYLDDFLLTTGKCPDQELSASCYSGGTLPTNGDRCQCPPNVVGRACESSLCSSSTCDCGGNKLNWGIIGACFGGGILLLLALITITVIIVKVCQKP